jgi:hypothetical protein
MFVKYLCVVYQNGSACLYPHSSCATVFTSFISFIANATLLLLNYQSKSAVKSDPKSKDIPLNNNLKAVVQTDQFDLSQHDDQKSRGIMHRYNLVLPR